MVLDIIAGVGTVIIGISATYAIARRETRKLAEEQLKEYQAIQGGFSALRDEMKAGFSTLGDEMRGGFSALGERGDETLKVLREISSKLG
jgi:hypothetical protein